jgi:uncharacterized protein YeaO (DUF488 family)
MQLRLKRAYEEPGKYDGVRVLVDRIWPRGLTKERARIDLWLKDVAPSKELRQWFGHDPQKWPEFKRRYFQELGKNRNVLDDLCHVADGHRVTLVFAAKEKEYNNAVALKEYLEQD